jgi:ferric-dicitrate binding protein FerR (iron transport regulator)
MRPDPLHELLDRWVCGELDAAGEAELERLVREDAGLARELLDQQRYEQALRILLGDDAADQQVAVSVLSVLRADGLDSFKNDLMARVRSEQELRVRRQEQARVPAAPAEAEPAPAVRSVVPPAPARHRRSRVPAAAAAALLLAAVAGTAAFLFRGGEVAVEGRAYLLAAGSGVQVQRGGQRLPGRADFALEPDDQLILEDSAVAKVGFSDDPTRLELRGTAALRLLRAGASKKVELVRGDLEISTPGQTEPLSALTPLAELRISDASALLRSAGDFTRVEVSRGHAVLLRHSDRRSVRVPAEHYAVAGRDVELAALPIQRGGPATGGPGAVAVVRTVQGRAYVFTRSPAERTPLKAGQPLFDVQSVMVEGARSLAVIEYPDRTRLEVAGETVLRRLADEKDRTRKLVVLEQGSVTADVAKQPAGKPMILRTVQAEATVLGTRFVLSTQAEGTRLAVEEGAVSFVRRADRQAVTVRSGFCSVAAPGRPLEPAPVPGWARYLDLDFASGAADGDGEWAVEGRLIRQRRVSRLAEGGVSTLLFKADARESLVLEAEIALDQVTPDTTPGRGTWGFGVEAMFRNRTVVLRSSQGPEGASVFEFFGASAIPFEHGREGVYRVKLSVDRRRDGEAVLRGKIWQGDREPDGWMIETTGDLEGPLTQVGLQTVRCACTFSSFKVKLPREESR